MSTLDNAHALVLTIADSEHIGVFPSRTGHRRVAARAFSAILIRLLTAHCSLNQSHGVKLCKPLDRISADRLASNRILKDLVQTSEHLLASCHVFRCMNLHVQLENARGRTWQRHLKRSQSQHGTAFNFLYKPVVFPRVLPVSFAS